MNKLDFTRTSQPQEIAQIDWSNPITRGLSIAAVPYGTTMRDAVSGAVMTTSGGPTAEVNKSGRVFKTVSGSSQYGYFPCSISNVPFTLFVQHTLDSSATGAIISLSTTSGSERHVLFYGSVVGSYSTSYIPNIGSGTVSNISSPTGTVQTAGIVARSAISNSVFCNGVIANTGTNTFTGSGIVDRLYISTRMNISAGVFSSQQVSVATAFNRALSDAEVKSLSQNPWQIFKPIQKPIFVPQPIAQEPYKVGNALTMPTYRKVMQKMWTSQPQCAVEIDWSNPLTRGIGPFDEPGGSWLTKNGVLAGGYFSTRVGVASTSAALSTNEFTLLVAFRTPASIGAQECLFGRGEFSSTNNTGFGFSISHVAGAYSGALYAGTSYTVIGKPTGGPLAPNTDYVIGLTCDGANARGFSAGILTAGPTPVSGINSSPNLSINCNSFGEDTSACKVKWYRYFSRCLSDHEVRSLTDNPWQIFKPLANKVPFTLPQYQVITPEIVADLIIQMTKANALATGIQAQILYDQLIQMLSASATTPTTTFNLDATLNLLHTSAQATGTSFNLDIAMLLAMAVANANASGIKANIDKAINIQVGNSIASGGNILLDKAINMAFANSAASGVKLNIDKTINHAVANAQATGIRTLIDIVKNMLAGNAAATSNGFGSGTVLNLNANNAQATGIKAYLDKVINQNRANATANAPKFNLDKAINTLVANASALGIKTNLDKVILTNRANALATGINTLIQYAISLAMNSGQASAIGTSIRIDKQVLLAAGIANATGINVSVVLGPLTYEPAYVVFTTDNEILILDVIRGDIITAPGQILQSLVSESRTKVFDSTTRISTFNRE